jgi:hypothetical protein
MHNTIIRFPFALRCPRCDRTLRDWDCVPDSDGLFEKLLCSGCHTLLLEIERTTGAKELQS